MLGYERLFQKPALFTRITGIKFEKFEILVVRSKNIWNQVEQKRLCSRQRKRAIGGGRKYKLESIESKVFLMLMFYRHNITHELLGFLFDLDASNVTRLIAKLSPIFEKAADPKLKTWLLKAKKFSEKVSTEIELFKKYPELKEICIDATEQRKQRSKDTEQRKLDYSGKKKAFTNKTQITTAENQRIIDITATYPGSVHDKKIFDKEKTIKKIPKQSTCLDDLGYLGVPKENPEHKIILPCKKKKGQKKLSVAEREFNKQHARKRIKVEHVFSRIKKFRICSETYRGKDENYNQILRNIAALVNLNYCTI